MKIYVTRYALSEGIKEFDAAKETVSGGMFIKDNDGSSIYFHGEGIEWHKTKEAAAKRAEEMRLARLVSLHKQIEKLETMKF